MIKLVNSEKLNFTKTTKLSLLEEKCLKFLRILDTIKEMRKKELRWQLKLNSFQRRTFAVVTKI